MAWVGLHSMVTCLRDPVSCSSDPSPTAAFAAACFALQLPVVPPPSTPASTLHHPSMAGLSHSSVSGLLMQQVRWEGSDKGLGVKGPGHGGQRCVNALHHA